ncbi:MAG: hypothetical protein IH953_04185 [Chloroflexi bacterium]|nr:hypothetical protein [Chloroflexota bacterium]
MPEFREHLLSLQEELRSSVASVRERCGVERLTDPYTGQPGFRTRRASDQTQEQQNGASL